MIPSARKGNWHFETLWTFPGLLPFPPIITSVFIHEVDSALKRDFLERDTRPPYLKSVELKYKLSDLEAVLNRSLRVTGYIQSGEGRAIDRDNLLRWFQATWCPLDGQLGQSDTYRKWSYPDQEYRHVLVSGEPALATCGTGKKQVCVRHRIYTPLIDLSWIF
jgi:hypothetical protein